jgi:uncharacterized membrane protein
MSQHIPEQAAARGGIHQVEIVISNLLRIGVATSLVIVVIGMVLTFVHHPEYLSSRDALKSLLSAKSEFPHSMEEMAAGLMVLRGRSVVILGLLLLIATPVMRVAVSIIAFLYERDRVFAIITTVVLMLLLLSFFLGRVKG